MSEYWVRYICPPCPECGKRTVLTETARTVHEVNEGIDKLEFSYWQLLKYGVCIEHGDDDE